MITAKKVEPQVTWSKFHAYLAVLGINSLTFNTRVDKQAVKKPKLIHHGPMAAKCLTACTSKKDGISKAHYSFVQ